MSINPLNSISKVYLEQVAPVTEANDGDLANNYPPYNKVTRGDIIAGALGQDRMGGKRKVKKQKVKEELVGGQNKIDVAPPYGKLTSDDFKQLRKGKRKKITREGFSNWRNDLSEVVDNISKEKNDQKITEKKVNNKIKINPTLDIGDRLSGGVRETVENLGGTLIEMVEIDEVDYIVESVYDELLDEGYEEDDIEEAIEYALIEAKVTYGHDTPTGQKKRGNILKAVGRLARQKLSSKVRSAKTSAKGAIASGARKVAKGALGVARKMEGDENPSKVHSKAGTRSSSTYRGSGAGQKERVSSGSYTPPSRSSSTKKAEPYKDPWEGSATTPPRSEKKDPKAETKTTKISSKQKRKQLYRDVLANVSGISDEERRAAALKRKKGQQNEEYVNEDYYDLKTKSVKSGNPGEQQKRTIEKLAKTATTKKKVRTPVGTSRRGGGSYKPSSPEEAKANIKSWGDYWSTAAKGYKEEYVAEKTLSSAETKKKEEIVKSMKSKLKDFEARYPGRGKEVMYATATKMAKKMAEQYIDEAKLPRSEKKSKKAEKLAGPKRPKHLVQLDLDQAALREVGTKKRRDPETGKKKTTKVEPAKINVKGEGGKVVRTVSTGDFHKEKLGKGETMDFSPLRDPEKFKQTTKANKAVINKARGAVVEPNTARGAFRRSVGEEVALSENNGKVDNKSIVQHLQNIGYNRKRGMTVKPGHFTGDMPGSGSPGKKLIATKHDIKKYQPQKVSHIDDDPKNLEPLEKHRKETQGKKGEARGSDPKIHTQHVGSYRKRGESRTEPREHGRVRRYSGVRDAGNIPEPQTTKQIQRARKKARSGMKEAVDMPATTKPVQDTKQAQQTKSAEQKAKQAAIAIKQKELQALRSTPAGTSVSGFGS